MNTKNRRFFGGFLLFQFKELDHGNGAAVFVVAHLAKGKEMALRVTDAHARTGCKMRMDLALVDLAAVSAKSPIEIGQGNGRQIGEQYLNRE